MEQNTEILKVKVYVEERTSDGRAFNIYKAVTSKNGVKVNLKFTKAVKNPPTENGYMYVDIDHINEQKNAEYPTVWVSEVVDFEPFSKGGNLDANRARMREMFGE